MGQEYFINSQELQDKVASLLPSQGGAGSSVDLSASTQIVPIIDLTEQAEGSNVRADLQTAFGINSTYQEFINTTADIISTTGYFRLFGTWRSASTSNTTAFIQITDGVTITKIQAFSASVANILIPFDFNVFLSAGDVCQAVAGSSADLRIAFRQIATIDGTLVNP